MTWKRTSLADGKCHTRYEHADGWEVVHCGHPTALWPYYLRTIADSSAIVVSHNGRGFRGVRIARRVVEGILDGSIEVTSEGCVDGVRRALVTAAGEELAAPTRTPIGSKRRRARRASGPEAAALRAYAAQAIMRRRERGEEVSR